MRDEQYNEIMNKLHEIDKKLEVFIVKHDWLDEKLNQQENHIKRLAGGAAIATLIIVAVSGPQIFDLIRFLV